ncbi:hypothetical protein CTAM01_03278 [Colletotrichum tamarilloi]|uniref:Uncharacterized protein n=1 Tax=Colletotrichum tamarilloi TaxID=1209934 RepID=A0ABQ9RMJ9_9PEZI|nr:uncharacterized protein CTAM01_03278 [Colletotrichum tamarilloi]KAK1506946.1 hypothetical protein CTAM01_03278 [Colletotrichum tamarilloi]
MMQRRDVLSTNQLLEMLAGTRVGIRLGAVEGHYSGVMTETLVPLPSPLFRSVCKRRRSLVDSVWGCRMRRRVAGRG